ncbi:MAG: hypothetical protein KDA77_13635, partial [Planctomycetaceae bacterium]|nr:hypothetical protein [Planctomycetaceae bacterium]
MLLTPQVLSPVHDGTTFDTTPTISWSAESGATHYEVWISQLGPNQGAVLIQGGIASTSFTVPNSLNAQEHRIWVRPFFGSTPGTWSASSDFFVSDQTASVTAPPHNGLSFDSTPTISWSSVSGAESYEIWVSEVGGSAVLIQGGVTGTSFTVPGPLDPQEHRVWVRPEAGGTSGAWSIGSDFFVSNETTSVVSPANHATTFDSTPTISWNAVTGAQSYEVWISEVGGSVVFQQTGIVSTSFTIPIALNAQEHRVWVRPEVNGTSGNWSPSSDFFVSEDTAVITSPAQNGAVFSLTPTVLWSPVAGAESYELWISEVDGGTVFDQSGITSASFTVPITLNEEEHRVWVRPFASGSFG